MKSLPLFFLPILLFTIIPTSSQSTTNDNCIVTIPEDYSAQRDDTAAVQYYNAIIAWEKYCIAACQRDKSCGFVTWFPSNQTVKSDDSNCFLYTMRTQTTLAKQSTQKGARTWMKMPGVEACDTKTFQEVLKANKWISFSEKIGKSVKYQWVEKSIQIMFKDT